AATCRSRGPRRADREGEGAAGSAQAEAPHPEAGGGGARVNPKAIRAYPRSTFDRAPVRGGSKLHVLIAEAIRDADPYASVEQFSRYRGDDIASLASEELDDERWRLRTARAFGVLTK